MAKQQKRKPQAKEEVVDNFTYSTRVTPEQRQVIDDAASLSNCTSAKFIREAAVSRAVHVVNAHGPAKIALRRLASIAAKQLVNPSVELDIRHHHRGEESDEKLIIDYREAFRRDDEDPMSGTVMKATPLRPHQSDLGDIRNALETCGTEFVRLILEQWMLAESETHRYQPARRVDDLLAGGDGE